MGALLSLRLAPSRSRRAGRRRLSALQVHAQSLQNLAPGVFRVCRIGSLPGPLRLVPMWSLRRPSASNAAPTFRSSVRTAADSPLCAQKTPGYCGATRTCGAATSPGSSGGSLGQFVLAWGRRKPAPGIANASRLAAQRRMAHLVTLQTMHL